MPCMSTLMQTNFILRPFYMLVTEGKQRPCFPPVFASATHFKGPEQMVDSRYVHRICIVNVRLVFIQVVTVVNCS